MNSYSLLQQISFLIQSSLNCYFYFRILLLQMVHLLIQVSVLLVNTFNYFLQCDLLLRGHLSLLNPPWPLGRVLFHCYSCFNALHFVMHHLLIPSKKKMMILAPFLHLLSLFHHFQIVVSILSLHFLNHFVLQKLLIHFRYQHQRPLPAPLMRMISLQVLIQTQGFFLYCQSYLLFLMNFQVMLLLPLQILDQVLQQSTLNQLL